MSSGAIYVQDSGNTKLNGSRKIDATYASIQATCPKTCPFMGEGCYAETSFVGITTRRLNKAAAESSALDVAREEAQAIRNSYGGGPVPSGRDLRIHVAGDSRTIKGTETSRFNSAVGDWKRRGGNDCWSYTHSWSNVPRKEWSNVSILASVSNVEEAKLARKQGYAPAIVVPEHPSDKVFKLKDSDVKWIPCPAQTKDNVSCSSCRLCFNTERLFDGNYGIAFAAHGVKRNNVKRRLTVMQ